jgi:phenylpyruvate tautomerase PptA (4-oxalocrotonate tautomerase family)
MRALAWVVIEEVKSGDWAIGGNERKDSCKGRIVLLT